MRQQDVYDSSMGALAVFAGAMKEAFGEALVRAYLAVRQSELAWDEQLKVQSASPAEHITRIATELYQRY